MQAALKAVLLCLLCLLLGGDWENPWLQHYSVALLMLSAELDFLNPTILLIKIIDLIGYCCQGIYFFDNDFCGSLLHGLDVVLSFERKR